MEKKTKGLRRTSGKNSECDDDETAVQISHGKTAVKKAKLSLQKQDGKIVSRPSLSNALGLNDTCDFKDDKIFDKILRKNKSKSKKTRTKEVKQSAEKSDSGKGLKQNESCDKETHEDIIRISDKEVSKSLRKDEEKQIFVHERKESAAEQVAPTLPKMRLCPTCELEFQEEEFQNHIKDCLQKFSRAIHERREKEPRRHDTTNSPEHQDQLRTPRGKATESKNKDGGQSTGQQAVSPPKIRHCPTCQLKYLDEEFQNHIKECLQKFSRAIQDRREKDNALIADKIKINEKRKQEVGDELPPMDDLAGEDYFLCQICQKDLSHMNSQRRTQHVNRCIDQMESSDSKAIGDRNAVQTSESAVLDCPMCGKALKTQASRKAHLKTCARALHVASDQLVQIVKLQEAEHSLKASNLQTNRTNQVKKVSRNKQASRTTKKNKMPLDEETQLAMALSSSLADEQKKREQGQLNQLNLRGITDACLQPQTGVNKKSKKKKNAQQVSKPPLLQLTKLEAQNRIAERVAQLIVCQQSTDEVQSTPPSNSSGLSDLPGIKLLVPDKENSLSTGMLWQRTALSDGDRGLDRLSLFYTKSLMPPVSMAQVKTNQRNLIHIAGRRKSAELDKTETPVCHEGESVASTQTAIVLAELAADAECESDRLSLSGTQNSVQPAELDPLTATEDAKVGSRGADSTLRCRSADASGAVSASPTRDEEIADPGSGTDSGQMEVNPLQTKAKGEGNSKVFWDKDLLSFVQNEEDELREASGFCPEDAVELKEEKEQQTALQRQYLELVDNTNFTDLKLKANNGSIVHAHQVILSVRCPKLMELPSDVNGHIPLDVPREAVLSVMKFVYGGVFSVDTHCLEDVSSLAERFDLKDLVSYCEKHKNKWSIKEAATQDAAAAEEVQERRSSIDLLLTEMFSDSDEPGDRQVDVLKKPADPSDEDEDEWREIYCSQRQQLQRTKSVEIGQGDVLGNTSSSVEQNCKVITAGNTIGADLRERKDGDDCGSDKVLLNQKKMEKECAGGGDDVLERKGDGIEVGKSDGSSSAQRCGEEELFSDDELELVLVSADASSDADRSVDKQTSDHKNNCVSEKMMCNNKSREAGECCDSSGNNDIEINTGSSSSDDSVQEASGPGGALEYSGGDEPCLIEIGTKNTSRSRTEEKSPVKDADKFEKNDYGKRKRMLTGDDYKSPLVAKCMEESRFESTEEVTPEVSRREKRMKMSTPLDTSGRSVVQEDSLYITPIPKRCQRSTFTLLTPATSSYSEMSKDKDVYLATPVGKIVKDSYGNESIVEFPADAGCSYLEENCGVEVKESSQKRTDSGGPSQVQMDRDVSCVPPSERSDLVDQSVHNESDSRKVRDTDSDVEITGDNFDEMSKSQVASPKFSSKPSLRKISCKDSEKRKGLNESSIAGKSKTDSELDKNGQSDVQVQNELSAKSNDNSYDNYEATDNFPADDVWEGFDELNAACDAEVYCEADTEESPQKRSGSPMLSQKQHPRCPRVSSDSAPSGKQVNNNEQSSDDADLPSPGRVGQEEFDVPSADSFMWDEANDPSLETSIVRDEQQKGKETFKTPVAQVSRKVTKKAVPPSPFSPMPNYDAMNTPQLKKAVTQFGVRPVGKKRMKIILADIYHQTHQYETDSDYEADQRSPQKISTSPSKTSSGVSSKSSSDSSKPSSKSSKASSASSKSSKAPSSTLAVKQLGKSHQQKTGSSSKFHDQVSDRMSSEVVSSDEASSQRSVSSSQESSCSEMLEESFMGLDEEDVPCSQQASESDLPTRLQQFILQRPDIHTKVLVYEPLELDWLKKEIREAGIRCPIQKLMDFLDEKCVTFTMKKMTKRNTKGQKAWGQKKKKINVPPENM